MQKPNSTAEALVPHGLLILREKQEAVEENVHGLWRQADSIQSLFFYHVTLNKLNNLSEPPFFPQKSVCVLTPLPCRLFGRINEIALSKIPCT